MVLKRRRTVNCRLYRLVGLLVTLIPAKAFAVVCGTALSPISVSATAVNFGTYDPLSPSPVHTDGTIVVACELNIDVLPAFNVSLSHGAANRFAPRTLSFGTSTLNYNLYTKASHTTIWGDGTGDTETRTYDGLLVFGHVEFTIYGQLPPGQFTNAGTYTDTIIITIEY